MLRNGSNTVNDVSAPSGISSLKHVVNATRKVSLCRWKFMYNSFDLHLFSLSDIRFYHTNLFYILIYRSRMVG